MIAGQECADHLQHIAMRLTEIMLIDIIIFMILKCFKRIRFFSFQIVFTNLQKHLGILNEIRFL